MTKRVGAAALAFTKGEKMKIGMHFDAVVAQVAEEAQSRHDFFAPTNELELVSREGESEIQLATPQGAFGLRDTAHIHLAEVTGIERRYYTRLRREAPSLLADNVNHWLRRSPAKPRLVRALGSDIRALASPRYATLDNDALLSALEPIIEELGMTVESCQLDEEGLTLKLVTPKLQGDVKLHDVVQSGLFVRNSEVSRASLSVQPLIFRLVCTNGLVLGGAGGQGASRRHIGRDWRADKDYSGQVLPNQERDVWEREIWNRLQEQIRDVLNVGSFQHILARLSATTRLQSVLEPEVILARMENLGDGYKIGPEIQAQIVRHLQVDSYNGTLWDLVNGATRTARTFRAMGPPPIWKFWAVGWRI